MKKLDKSLLRGFKYSPQTGVFYRVPLDGANHERNRHIGPVTRREKRGYIAIKINGIGYKAHRLAFIAMGITDIDGMSVDHINGKLDDNRWCNLRLVSHRENMQNMRFHRSGKLPGTRQFGRRWAARLRVGKGEKHLGMFDSAKEAHAAYLSAVSKLNGTN